MIKQITYDLKLLQTLELYNLLIRRIVTKHKCYFSIISCIFHVIRIVLFLFIVYTAFTIYNIYIYQLSLHGLYLCRKTVRDQGFSIRLDSSVCNWKCTQNSRTGIITESFRNRYDNINVSRNYRPQSFTNLMIIIK